VYVSYTTDEDGPRRSVISQIDGWDRATEDVILELEQPYSNHNGGHIAFGPDGFLYIGFGDGGSGGDPLGAGQDTGTLLGKMLRIDVKDRDGDYGIPSDNPFAGGGGSPEIFAWGLRNPWRWSFDPASGDLWVGDVGQNAWEEIDLVERGGNYGWNAKEGTHCYAEEPCDDPRWIDPIVEYSHDEGASVTGGVGYRGSSIPELAGTYLYADFGSGRMWGLAEDPTTGERVATVLLDTGLAVSSFGQGHDGEAYVVGYGGTLHRVVRAAEPDADAFPRTLSATGCFDADDPTRPAEGLVPYAPIATLWSDGAEKRRWMALPDGEAATADEEGDWELPVGSVLVKEFHDGDRRLETRLMVRHEDGGWAGYTYVWRADGSDADWAPAGASVGSWTVPTSGQCLQCHTEAAGRSLGLESAQLDHVGEYGDREANQLETLVHVGMIEGVDPDAVEPLPEPSGNAPVEARARAYVHANCAGCHQPGGTGRGDLDLRFATALPATGICGEPTQGDLGLDDAAIVAPGEPDRSVLLARMKATDVHRMPPIGSAVVDAEGTALVEAWIASLASCP
jgi:uncharacterized repeat protein (TIGR03806 family)